MVAMDKVTQAVGDELTQHEECEEVVGSVDDSLHMTINAAHLFWRDVLQSPRYILAPMVEQSELAFRLLVRQYGVQCTYSPMFNASIFLKDVKYQRDSLQVLPELDKPLLIQFCANDPDTFVEAARIAAPLCEAIDLNLGCPQIIAKRGHYGSFLQDEWDLIYNIVNQAVKELKKPITCKIRVFEDIDKTIRYAKMIESAGASLLTVHGRTREQKGPLTGLASWEHVRAVKEALSIPVFANGNIQSKRDIDRCLAETGVEGVMSAEGTLYNPAIFTGDPIPVWKAAREYLALARQHTPPFSYIRGHIFKFFHHCFTLQEHAALRHIVAKTRVIDDLSMVADRLEERYRVEYDSFRQAPSSVENQPDQWPIFFCKPYYRPAPTSLNSKIPATEQESSNTGDGRPSKRQLKRQAHMQAAVEAKKIRALSHESKNEGDKAKPKVKLELCTQEECPNPKGAKCEYQLCRQCCREKTTTESLECSGHRFWAKINKSSDHLQEASPTEVVK